MGRKEEPSQQVTSNHICGGSQRDTGDGTHFCLHRLLISLLGWEALSTEKVYGCWGQKQFTCLLFCAEKAASVT